MFCRKFIGDCLWYFTWGYQGDILGGRFRGNPGGNLGCKIWSNLGGSLGGNRVDINLIVDLSS